MIIREMLDIRTPICKVCQGALGRIMVYRDDYKGHLYFCHDCGTEYKIVGQGQSDIELLMEYERKAEDECDKCPSFIPDSAKRCDICKRGKKRGKIE